jgi:hypothetical protein
MLTKIIPGSLTFLFLLCSVWGEVKPLSDRQKIEAELDTLKDKLAPLKARAKIDPKVVEADAQAKAAYRTYALTLREAMLRLDPTKQKDIAREAELRKKLKPPKSGPPVNQ